jgi:hypothetical protein
MCAANVQCPLGFVKVEKAIAIERLATSPRKAVYSVTEVAALVGISRARFYDLVKDGVMPYPVHCIRTRRPLYVADTAAICVRVRKSNIGIDGRYVIFYARREQTKTNSAPALQPPDRPSPPDPLLRDMIETLRAMHVQADDAELTVAITQQCPDGVKEETFEADLRTIFDRCRNRQTG